MLAFEKCVGGGGVSIAVPPLIDFVIFGGGGLSLRSQRGSQMSRDPLQKSI